MKCCKLLVVVMAGLTLLPLTGCGKKHRRYPEGDIGWHSPDYGRIYGKLQLVAAGANNPKAYWIIRYATTTGPDIYGGKAVLMPESMMTGYAGGEYVELTGHLRPDTPNPAGTGVLYEVNAIRIWVGHDRD